MTAAKILAGLGVAAMTAVLLYAFAAGDFFAEGRVLTAMPWGVVSLVDLYTGFALFAGWIIFREESLVRAALWIVLLLVLGFFTGSLYALIALHRSRGDWDRFWMGHRRQAANSGG